MDEMGWGITFVLIMATLVTVVLTTLIVQLFATARLKLTLRSGASGETREIDQERLA